MLEADIISVQKWFDEGMSLRSVGERLGVSVSTMRYWLRKNPTVRVPSIKWDAPLNRQKMIEAIGSSSSVRDILKTLGLACVPGNYTTVHNFAVRNQLDLSTILKENQGRLCANTVSFHRVDKGALFVENSLRSRASLKRIILKEGLIPYVCSYCGNTGEWMGRGMVLILDHINGINNDNRLENLRFCCPNCNSQLDTHCGKHLREKVQKICRECGNPFVPMVHGALKTVCGGCSKPKRKTDYGPFSIEALTKLEAGVSYEELGREYGITGNSVKKRLISAGYTPPKKRYLSNKGKQLCPKVK